MSDGVEGRVGGKIDPLVAFMGECGASRLRRRVMVRRLTVLLATLVAVGVTAGVATDAGAQKFDLLGPHGNALCDGSGVLSGSPGGFGFAIINAPSNGTVRTTVSAKGLAPNATYNVLLVQGISDCYTSDGTLTTNGHGNGNAQISEPSTSTHAFVALCLGGSGGSCVGASEGYVTHTYIH